MEFKHPHKDDIPEGYFENLEKRLQSIPSQHSRNTPRVIQLLRKSWVAAAAVAVLIGFNYWKNTTTESENYALTEEEYYELLIASTEDYELLYYGLIDVETTDNEAVIEVDAYEYSDYDIIGLE